MEMALTSTFDDSYVFTLFGGPDTLGKDSNGDGSETFCINIASV